MTMHKLMAETLDTVIEEIKAIQKNARENGVTERPKVAYDNIPFTKGLDRSEGCRRQADRGYIQSASGTNDNGSS